MKETVNGATHTWTITYDARGRLETVTRDDTHYNVYGYDPNGNLTAINGARSERIDAQDRHGELHPPGGGSGRLAYTNNGDLTDKTSGRRRTRSTTTSRPTSAASRSTPPVNAASSTTSSTA